MNRDEQGFGSALVNLTIVVQRRYGQICADHGLTATQAQLLCMLKDGPRGMTELARLLGLAKPGLSGLVDRIEKLGMVTRETSEQDRRAITLNVTPRGKEAADALYADVGAHLPDTILTDLAPADREHLERIVRGIVAAHAVGCEGPPVAG
ncbi:MarR family transcriptional regulator [Actinoplanes sp. NBRC 101535]|uniref:MarR family winged helix-turn-helix transcriptional regulator n=1 Tax=Actinoplanes sp. NBRC 101535 TaxID=3032196 RepID=UPI0024A028CC|nr:MarR family transcriptional regulator [Actinoplanes sp. NBRC 101535]GLY06370.1 hypothetical protein Acsp01_67490 [Actinoplanes sp. NBRC 101535]